MRSEDLAMKRPMSIITTVAVFLTSLASSAQVQWRASSTAPVMESSHSSSGTSGVGPADRTGKSRVRYGSESFTIADDTHLSGERSPGLAELPAVGRGGVAGLLAEDNAKRVRRPSKKAAADDD